MNRFIALVLIAGCTVKYVTPPTVPPGEARVEARAMPPDPATEPLPEGIPPAMKVVPVEQDDKAPFAGILVSEGKSVYFDNYITRYKELRSFYESDRKVWAAHRELYETRLVLADKAIHELQPSWWDRNALSFGLVGGLVLGIAITVAGVSLAK